MRIEFRMPDIGEGIAEIEIIEWLVEVGDHVSADQPIVLIQTDKSTVEMPATADGVVAAYGGQVGDILPVGGVLVVIESDGSDVSPPGPTAKAALSAVPSPEALRSVASDVAPAAEGSETSGKRQRRPLAAPKVRRLALDRGLDLTDVVGTGPNGRVTREDVLAATETPAPASASPQVEVPAPRPAQALSAEELDRPVPLRGLRRQIAKRMIESWQQVPHIIDYREADATQLVRAREDLRAAHPERASTLTYVPLLVKVTAVALRAHPLLNASLDMEAQEYVLHSRINIGVATATSGGLLVPVVHDADRKSILEIATEIQELTTVTREGRATSAQLSGGTYTVNNLGALGGSMSTPIIRLPEVGIMGFGRVADRVVAVDGQAVVRTTVMLNSVGDHRLHDGDTLSSFTNAVIRLIESPYALLADLH